MQTQTQNSRTANRVSKNQNWTREACIAEAQKHENITQWHRNGAGSYRKAKQKADEGWWIDCIAHMPEEKGTKPKAPSKWTREACLKEAAKYNSKVSWLKASSGSYRSAERYGWMNDCSAHMSKRTIWTRELVLNEVAKHSTKSKWQQSGKGSYAFAKTEGEAFMDMCIKNLLN